MKRIQKLLLKILVLVLALAMQAGNLTAFAEQSDLPLTQTLPSAALEDGHFDADLLKQWVDAYLDENNWSHPGCDMSIAFWYSGTDETWFYNADEWIGCVNWYKLPVCMYYAEKLKSGEMTKETVVTGITLEYAMNTLLEHSSGPSLYSLVTDLEEREGLSYTDVAKQYADLPESYFASEYYNNSYTARLMMEITKTLFEGGEERFPFVLEHMKKSQPVDLFKRDWNVRTKWEVAQTHAADWGGESDDLIHCTGIFYTPTPAILTVMTRNIWDLDIIGGVAGHFFALTEELDLKQHPERSAQAITAAAESGQSMEAATGDAAEDTQITNSMPGAGTVAGVTSTGEAQQTSDTPATTVTPEQSVVEPQPVVLPTEETPPTAGTETGTVINSSPSPVPILIVLFVLLVLIVICSILLIIYNRKERERRRRRAAAIRRIRREREMQERYGEENESYDEE